MPSSTLGGDGIEETEQLMLRLIPTASTASRVKSSLGNYNRLCDVSGNCKRPVLAHRQMLMVLLDLLRSLICASYIGGSNPFFTFCSLLLY